MTLNVVPVISKARTMPNAESTAPKTIATGA